MNRLLGFVFLMSLAASGVLASKCAVSDCPTFADGVTEWELTLFPVPKDCTQYIMCQRGYKHVRPCPEDLHFNPILNVCDWPKDAKCTECVEEIIDETCAEPKECPTIEDGVTEWDLTLLPVPADCTKFIMCQRGYRHLMDCPAGLHFNSILDVCDYPKDAGCTGCETTPEPEPETESPKPETDAPEPETDAPEPEVTEAPVDKCKTPTCPAKKPLVLLPIPSNCQKFVSCIYGYPTEVKCPDGLYFSAKYLHCTIPILSGCKNC